LVEHATENRSVGGSIPSPGTIYEYQAQMNTPIIKTPVTNTPILHGYFRSSASWRVRLALHLKHIIYEDRFVHLRNGDQLSEAHRALHPQSFVPVLEIDALRLIQSLAICDYLDETRPQSPLLIGDAAMRARIRAFAQVIACDTHPVQNLKILKRAIALSGDQATGAAWARSTIEDGFAACEALLATNAGLCCFGDTPTLADIILVPQMANARRFSVDLARYPRLVAIDAHCATLPAFMAAAPEAQGDYEA
jgi:maleylpyruvate isomerase